MPYVAQTVVVIVALCRPAYGEVAAVAWRVRERGTYSACHATSRFHLSTATRPLRSSLGKSLAHRTGCFARRVQETWAPEREGEHYREAARQLTVEFAHAEWGLTLRCTAIDARAVAAHGAQWVPGFRAFHAHKGYARDDEGWNWRELVWAHRNKTTRLEAAFWCDDALVGLVVGRQSPGRTRVSIHRLAASPVVAHPAKRLVTPLEIALGTYTARAYGAGELRILEPLPAVVGIYAENGLTPVAIGGTVRYCFTRL